MAGPQVYLSWPTTFRLIPDPRPYPLPPPVNEHSLRSPFGINEALFFGALDWKLPFTIAALYVASVFYLNSVNKRNGHVPWRISRSKAFKYFVISHNVVLALYSAVTFVAMARAITHVWPGLNNSAGTAGIADALCKLHGPRGLGDAATYNVTTNIFEVKNTLIKLGYDGNPDPTDVGRLWNEGLAFWGWFFYVSKFYEVLDTAIILAKGKRSATLQTYHHAGAMLCMWAGIRYMSPPIWMFVFINSFIHAAMYFYFTFSALGYRIPQGLKRLLTSLQIAQFVFGASYAAAHLFVQYDVPIATPYQIVHVVQKAASSASSAVVAATSVVSSFVESPTLSPSYGAMLKKYLLRAAGEEGVAERIHNNRGELLTPHMEEKIEQFKERSFETKWHTELTKTKCIDTSGEAFAIFLNLFYLAPLTYLFGRFFVRAYTQRGKPRTATDATKRIGSSARQAARDTNSAVEKVGDKAGQKIVEGANDAKKESKAISEDVKSGSKSLQDEVKQDLQKIKQGTFTSDQKTADRFSSIKATAKDVAADTRDVASSRSQDLQDLVQSAQEAAVKALGASKQKTEEASTVVKEESSEAFSSARQKIEQVSEIFSSEGSGLLGPSPKKSPAVDGPAVTIPDPSTRSQDATLAATEAVRPGEDILDEANGREVSGVESSVDDLSTDAMGQSGSIIDLAKEEALPDGKLKG